MTDPSTERVLVVPAALLHEAGTFLGFRPDPQRYLPRLLDPAHLLYLPREQAEHDPAYKQLIPYVVLRCGELLFHYTRGHSGTEARLRARRSVGIGGHICSDDGQPTTDAYRAGMLREVHEEVVLEVPFRERCVGLINDDRTPVGQVHVGIVHILDLDSPDARPREDALQGAGFAPLGELRQGLADFETWSQFLLDAL